MGEGTLANDSNDLMYKLVFGTAAWDLGYKRILWDTDRLGIRWFAGLLYGLGGSLGARYILGEWTDSLLSLFMMGRGSLR